MAGGTLAPRGAAAAAVAPRALVDPASDAAGRLAAAGLVVARYGVALVLLWIGLLKFTPAEAQGIGPLITTSPLLSWMYDVWSVAAASRAIGVAEIVAAALIALRPLTPRVAAAGSALAVATFATTLSFLATAPGAWDPPGFPMLGGAGQFLIKDVVFLGVSLWSLGDALLAARARSGATR